MGLNRFPFGDIALGMNSLVDPYELRAGEAASAVNVVPGGRGTYLQVRGGAQRMNDFGTSPIMNVLFWRLRNLIVVAQLTNNIKSCTALNGSVTTRFTSANPMTTNQQWCFEIAKDSGGAEKLWGVNGVDVPQKWDGITATTVAWVNPPPTKCRFIRLWKNRMVAGGDPDHPDRLYYSDIGDPELPATWNFIDLRSSYDDSETLTWCELSGENLLVFRPSSTVQIYDSNTFASRRLGGPGATHVFMSAELEGTVYFAAEDGLYFTSGADEPQLADPKVDLTNTLTFGGPSDGSWSRVVADPTDQCIYYVNWISGPPTVWIYYPPRTKNNPRKEGVWFQQFFGVVTKPYSLMVDNILGTHRVLVGDDRYLMAYFEGVNYDDIGVNTPFDWSWKTGWVRLVDFESIERVRRVNMRVKGGASVVVATRDESFSSSVYGGSTLFFRLRPEIRGREFQIRFTGSSPTLPGALSCEIHDLEIMFRGGKEHTMRDNT